MPDSIKSLVFALILCLVCSLTLAGASVGLRQYQNRNIRIDRQTNVLKSVGLVEAGTTYSPEEIDALFARCIRCLRLSPDGRPLADGETHPRELAVYLNVNPDQSIENYIIPINTKGLWGDIRGYLAIRRDGRTISGFTVFKHSETPGLGGEIEKQWFQKNFAGKQIVNQANEFVAVTVAKGPAGDRLPADKQAHTVDGISGATLTGKYLSQGLHDLLKEYEPVSIRFRQNELKQLPPGQGLCPVD
jgi:Na+-transporting NADH:ubiquinone oxidoreductase subunit C